jgi:hypothetical protein
LTSLTLFASEVSILFGFFDLVHGGSVREVLNLARRDSFFLLLLLDGVVHVDVLLDTQLLKVFLELTYAVLHFRGGCIEGIGQFLFVDIYFTVFKELNFVNSFLSAYLVSSPVLFAFSLPFF